MSRDNEKKSGMLNEQYDKDPHCKLCESDLELLSSTTACISKYIDEEKPSKLQQQVLRSLPWIGISVQDDVPEDKISKLYSIRNNTYS